MAVPTQATQALTDDQIASFEEHVVARGVKLGNWWAQQVAQSLSAHESLDTKRDVIGACLIEARRWRPTMPLNPRKQATSQTTIGAWRRLVEEWRRQQRDVKRAAE